MQLTLMINSVVCVLGAAGGLKFAIGSILTLIDTNVRWRGPLVVAALLMPVLFVVSGIGAWLAYSRAANQLAIGLVVLPWAYGVLFVLAMLASIKS